VWAFADQVESVALESFKHNAVRGRSIMMDAVDLIPAALRGRFDPKAARTID
jgi:hypothetical protein